MIAREFRPDINGLRAVAVVAVLLFHFGVPGARGGFIGVDVFFVISGFLMTKIIVSRLDNGAFSILRFYLERVGRLVPALAVVCGFVLVAGYVRLSPPDYEANARHVLTSLLFVSNFDYLRHSSYFDSLQSENWLLHTWSLSLEF
jgi:peptidoglycan/LPS O-acetylase OafA/YrhL